MTRPEDGPRLLAPDLATVDALAVPDLGLAARLVGLSLPAGLVDETWLWRLRREQLTHSPGDLAWTARLLVVEGRVVGHAGFHGAPDERGAVELGYWVAPEHRRRGHGATALRLLEEWGRADPRVHVLQASVSPANDGSTRLVLLAGYTAVRTVQDDDGPEVLHELDVT